MQKFETIAGRKFVRRKEAKAVVAEQAEALYDAEVDAQNDAGAPEKGGVRDDKR